MFLIVWLTVKVWYAMHIDGTPFVKDWTLTMVDSLLILLLAASAMHWRLS